MAKKLLFSMVCLVALGVFVASAIAQSRPQNQAVQGQILVVPIRSV